MRLHPFLGAIKDHIKNREREEGVVFTCDRRLYAAAVFIIKAALGDHWCERTLSLRSPDPYLANQSGHLGHFKFQDRVVALGELLLNLGRIRGFEQRLEVLRRESLEAIVAELEGARLLMSNAIPFYFIRPSGCLGQDYDALATIDGSPVACEMKAKLEQTEPSLRSVRDTLDRARRQLPNDQPGVVFLKLPEAWTTSECGRAAIEGGVKAALGRTRRISAVIVHWEQWQSVGSGALRAVRFLHVRNPRARIPLEALAKAVKAWPATMNGDWIELEKLVCDARDIEKSFATSVAVLSAGALARGSVPPVGYGVVFYGSLKPLLASETMFLTVFDFRSAEFGLFSDRSDRSARVMLTAGPARSFTVVRGEEIDAFQFQIPSRHLNSGVSDGDAAVVDLQTLQSAAESPQNSIEGPDTFGVDDPLTSLIANIFDQLRIENDLQDSQCVLRDLRVSFLVPGGELAFQVRYWGRTFTV